MFLENIINLSENQIVKAAMKVIVNPSKGVQEKIKEMLMKNMEKKCQKNIIRNYSSNMLLLIFLDMRLGKSDVGGELKNKY
jgi:hypothetical protein